jgi:protein-tyrosine phosphatase
MGKLVAEAGLEESIELDSAGTGGWHVGEPPDARATEAARARGIELRSVARQVRTEDFERFDLILAMDGSNQHALRQMAPDEASRAKVRLLREFDPASMDLDDLDVPDPYYDSRRGFEVVLDQVQAACVGLLEQVRSSETR